MPFKRHGTYRFNDFEMDMAQRSLRRGSHAVAISAQSFDLLAFLVVRAPAAATQEELVSALWPHASVEESNLRQHIYLLRNALAGEDPGGKIIASVGRDGYQLTAPVSKVRPSEEERPEPEISAPPARLTGGRSRRRVAISESQEDEAEEVTATGVGFVPRVVAAIRGSGLWQGVIVAGLVMVVGLSVWLIWSHQHPAPNSAMRTIVADFQNATGDAEFDQSLRTALTIDLRQSPYLTLIGDDQVRTALDAMSADAASPAAPVSAGNDLGDAPRQACIRVNGQLLFSGGIRRLGPKYMVTVQALDCARNSSRAISRGIADSPDNVLTVLDKVAADLRRQLGEPRSSIVTFRKPLFPWGMASIAALKPYAGAVQLASDGKWSESISLFERAIELDSQFTNAYEDLGLAYSNLGQREQAAANLTRAYELRDKVNTFDRLNIIARWSYLVSGDLAAGIRNFKAANLLYPSNAAFLAGLADLEIKTGKPALALDPIRQALALDAGNAAVYELLAGAQMRLGQFEQAAETCQQAMARKVDTAQIHIYLLQIAYLRLDQPAIDAQLAWAKGKPEEPELRLQQAQIEMAQGKVKSAQAIFLSVAEGLRKQGQNERADRILASAPRRVAELGLVDTAGAELGRLPAVADSADVAVAWAETGENSRAQGLTDKGLEANPASTQWQFILGPQMRAAIALNQHQPKAAIDALQPALPYDMASLDLPALRGRAYLADSQPQLAETEFHKILDHPGADPLSLNYPLAQLGLARALAQQGKTAEAGFAYKIVLQIWKDADADLPRVREARAESAKVNGEGAASGSRSRY
jgi:DNA-binding winged helix-turn-helix (wHTH) protein/tetratricopeptide (TPR) repeat protein